MDDPKSGVRVECPVCKEEIEDGKHKSISCDNCECWSHLKCTMLEKVFKLLTEIEGEKKVNSKKLLLSVGILYYCDRCLLERCSNASVKLDSTSTQTLSFLFHLVLRRRFVSCCLLLNLIIVKLFRML